MMNKKRITIYEDNDWTIEIVEDNEPHLRISCFENFHYVEEIDITRSVMKDEILDIYKEMFSDIKLNKGEM